MDGCYCLTVLTGLQKSTDMAMQSISTKFSAVTSAADVRGFLGHEIIMISLQNNAQRLCSGGTPYSSNLANASRTTRWCSGLVHRAIPLGPNVWYSSQHAVLLFHSEGPLLHLQSLHQHREPFFERQDFLMCVTERRKQKKEAMESVLPISRKQIFSFNHEYAKLLDLAADSCIKSRILSVMFHAHSF